MLSQQEQTSPLYAESAPRTAYQQPLHAAQLADALLKIQTVQAITGLSAPTIYRKVAAKDFPEPVRLGTRCTRWRAGAVMAWLQAVGKAAA